VTIAKYFFFSIIAMALNIGSQYLSLVIYGGFASLYVAILIGTLIGFVAKYFLDKKYVFNFVARARVEEAKVFSMYGITGILTTVIFWGVEIGFDMSFDSKYAKYIGAFVGLSIGYILKYFLDKRYVFKGCNS